MPNTAITTSTTQIPDRMNDAADDDNIADLSFMTSGHCYCHSTFTQYAFLSIFAPFVRVRVCNEGKMGAQ